MRDVFLYLHLFAFAAFAGSVFGHVALGAAFQPNADMAGYAGVLAAQHLITQSVIFGGQAVLMASGIGLVATRGLWRNLPRWLLVKLGLVALVILNGALVLAPIGAVRAEMAARAAAPADLPAAFADLGQRESLFGAANLLMVLVVVALTLRQRRA